MPSISNERRVKKEKKEQTGFVAGLRTEIAELVSANIELASEVTELKKLNGTLKGQLTKANKKTDELEAHVAELTDELKEALSAPVE